MNGDGVADEVDDETYWKMCQEAIKKEQELADRDLPGTLGFECDQSRAVYKASEEKRMAEFEQLRDQMFSITANEPVDLNGDGEPDTIDNALYAKMCEELEKQTAELQGKGLPCDLLGFEPDQERMIYYNGSEEKRMAEFEAMKANLFAMTNDEPCDLDGDGKPDEYNEEDIRKVYQETVKKAWELDQKGLPGDLDDFTGQDVIMPIFEARDDYEKKTLEYEKKLEECFVKVDEVLDNEDPDKAREMLKKIKEVFFKMDEMCIEHDDLEDLYFYEDLMEIYQQKY